MAETRAPSMARGADRISDLPEAVIHNILSLLPAQDAVRTCVLAQCWRNRWQSAPALRFACSTDLVGVADAFRRFVDGLLRVRRGGPPLDSRDFDLDVNLESCDFDLDKHGYRWIFQVMMLKYVFNRDLKWCPAFNKLKTLVLSKWFLSTDLSALIWFLHHTPLLEKLTLEIPKERESLMETEGSYNPLEKSIAPSHLQMVEVICKDVDGIVLKVLKVLNANGIALGKIRIQCSGYNFVCTDINK